ncbi:MAG TPA: DUF2789 domain-containing protein [bacterium]|nr:DUF2789 domain-containing protein [bacterium]
MEHGFHPLTELFDQLGLSSDAASIDAFVAQYCPLNYEVALADAPFWTVAQAQFIREAIEQDADWVEAVDHLDALLR